MTTKDIRPATTYTPCDVCGRTLLRGEKSEVYIGGGHRHTVCELCKPRALQEGWIREGAVPEYDAGAPAQERRRGVFGRRRRTREGAPGTATTLDEALSGGAWPVEPPSPQAAPASFAPAQDPPPRRRERPTARERSAPRERPVSRDRAADAPATPGAPREPRHVRAVPTGDDGRIAAAAQAFNQSEHPRTVAGVSRSLGAPAVAIIPDPAHPSLVRIVASWELCWYRYEVDLGSERASVRLDTQGYELSELSERERVVAAAADDAGQLHLPA